MELAFNNIPNEKWRYFHKKSVENFIYYLPNIKGRNEKQELTEILEGYLTDIEAEHDIIDMHLSEYLFNTYIGKVAPIFEYRLGFVPVPAKKALLVLLPILFFFLWLAYSKIYLFIIFVLILFAFLKMKGLKKAKGKVYGFGY